jgi:fructose-bisphosphate aldolase class 1
MQSVDWTTFNQTIQKKKKTKFSFRFIILTAPTIPAMKIHHGRENLKKKSEKKPIKRATVMKALFFVNENKIK